MVISNDAGSTEYISHIILNEKNYNWVVYALKDSLASKIFKKYDIEFDTFKELDELINIVKRDEPSIILYGTGWQVDFSYTVKSICLNNNIKSIALIDHWSNYKERFSENSLPDLILVMDDLANKMAIKEFTDKVNIIQIKNYFFESVISDFHSIKNKIFDSIVFISEPTVVNKIDLDAYEYTLVENLLLFFDDIIIRLHPSENEDKYDAIISKFPKVNVKIINPYEEDLLITLTKSKLTIGLGSMALYISYLLNINTISCVLNSKIKPSIPIPEQYILKDLKDLKDIVFLPLSLDDLNKSAVEFSTMIDHVLKDS